MTADICRSRVPASARPGPAVSPDAFRTDYLYTVENDIVTLADKPDNHPHGFVNKISFPLSSP